MSTNPNTNQDETPLTTLAVEIATRHMVRVMGRCVLTGAGGAALRHLTIDELAAMESILMDDQLCEQNLCDGLQPFVFNAYMHRLPEPCVLMARQPQQSGPDVADWLARRLATPVAELDTDDETVTVHGEFAHTTTPAFDDAMRTAAFPYYAVAHYVDGPPPSRDVERSIALRVGLDGDAFVEHMSSRNGAALAALSKRRLLSRATGAVAHARLERALQDYANMLGTPLFDALRERALYDADASQTYMTHGSVPVGYEREPPGLRFKL